MSVKTLKRSPLSLMLLCGVVLAANGSAEGTFRNLRNKPEDSTASDPVKVEIASAPEAESNIPVSTLPAVVVGLLERFNADATHRASIPSLYKDDLPATLTVNGVTYKVMKKSEGKEKGTHRVSLVAI